MNTFLNFINSVKYVHTHTTFHRAGLSAHLEQGSSWGNNKSRSRPAGILVANWDRGLSAAFDVSVMSPLNPTLIVEASTPSGVAARAAEGRKHEKTDEKCSELGWQCIPIVVETYVQRQERQALSQLASQLAARTNGKKNPRCCAAYMAVSVLLWSGPS